MYKEPKKPIIEHEINGENISELIKIYLEQFIAAFPNIFPRYIPEINITYRNIYYKAKEVDTENKSAVMFDIIERRRKNITNIENINEGQKIEYSIDNEELEIFSRDPNKYLLIFIERALGKIYKERVSTTTDFMEVISPHELYEARKYFQKQNIYKNTRQYAQKQNINKDTKQDSEKQNINKDNERLLLNFFIKYGVKYLQKNDKDMPYKVKIYLDSIF